MQRKIEIGSVFTGMGVLLVGCTPVENKPVVCPPPPGLAEQLKNPTLTDTVPVVTFPEGLTNDLPSQVKETANAAASAWGVALDASPSIFTTTAEGDVFVVAIARKGPPSLVVLTKNFAAPLPYLSDAQWEMRNDEVVAVDGRGEIVARIDPKANPGKGLVLYRAIDRQMCTSGMVEPAGEIVDQTKKPPRLLVVDPNQPDGYMVLDDVQRAKENGSGNGVVIFHVTPTRTEIIFPTSTPPLPTETPAPPTATAEATKMVTPKAEVVNRAFAPYEFNYWLPGLRAMTPDQSRESAIKLVGTDEQLARVSQITVYHPYRNGYNQEGYDRVRGYQAGAEPNAGRVDYQKGSAILIEVKKIYAVKNTTVAGENRGPSLRVEFSVVAKNGAEVTIIIDLLEERSFVALAHPAGRSLYAVSTGELAGNSELLASINPGYLMIFGTPVQEGIEEVVNDPQAKGRYRIPTLGHTLIFFPPLSVF